MSKAIIMHETGGPEVLKWEALEPGDQGQGHALVRHEAGKTTRSTVLIPG